MTIITKQEAIVKEMKDLDEWFDKYEYIINLGRQLEPLDSVYKTGENVISGCQSKVWLIGEQKQGLLYFSADSDTLITKGIISLLLTVCNHESAKDIVETDFYFLDKIGLNSNLSPSRANGVASIVKRIKDFGKREY